MLCVHLNRRRAAPVILGPAPAGAGAAAEPVKLEAPLAQGIPVAVGEPVQPATLVGQPAATAWTTTEQPVAAV